MTPEQSKKIAGNNVQMLDIKFLSHFAQLCRKSKERYEGEYQIPFCEDWFAQPTNEYNPGLAFAGMGICLSGYKNLPSNDYKYIRGSLAALKLEDIDISSYYHLNDENYIAALDDVNQISYAIGHRKINVTENGSKTEKDLLVILVRGTSVSIEWNSNSNVANSVADGDFEIDYHEGFKKSADSAYVGIKKYIKKHNIDGENTLLWIIGHSRGATIANVLAAIFNEDTEIGFPKEHVYSYNFSSSTTTRRADANGPAFDNIFNVMNPEDYIPRIPPTEWEFKRFGRDLFFPSIATSYADYRKYREPFLKQFKLWTRTDFPAFHGNAQTNWFQRHIYNISPNAADMYCRGRYTQSGTITFAQYFRIFTDIAGHRGKAMINDAEGLAKYGFSVFDLFLKYFLRNQIGGHNAPGAHQEEGYLAKLKLCYEMDIDIEKNSVCDTKRFTVYGPVEMIVRNENENIVAFIDNGKIDEDLYNTEDFIAMFYDEECGATQVWMPNEGKYSIEIRSGSDDKLDCTWTTLGPLGDVIEQKFYADVPFKKDTAVKWSDIEPAQPTSETTECNNLNVEVKIVGADGVAKDGETLNLWNSYGNAILEFPTDKVIADALPVRNATMGDHAAVHAYHDKHLKFRGWFLEGSDPDKDNPISTEKDFVFRIMDNANLVAYFDKR